MFKFLIGILLWSVTAHAEIESARQAATAAIDTNLTHTTLELYSTLDHSAAKYVRNPNCWAAGFDLTCVAVFNSFGMSLSTNGCCPWESPTRRAGTLISPRHLIYAHHYEIPVGTQLRFVTRMNTIVTSTLAKSAQVAGTDLQIGVLEANVPTNLVRFAKVLPADFLRYFPDSLKGLPALGLNQREEATVADIASFIPSPTNASMIAFTAPQEAERLRFYRDKISGDSSQPAFLIIEGEPVLLTVWTGGGGGSGYFISGYLQQIDETMKTLGGGFHLTPVNLNRFTHQ